MPYIATNYSSNSQAPRNNWVCSRVSTLGPYDGVPPQTTTSSPNFCGQCVSYVTRVCQTLPVNTREWKKGLAVKDNADIVEGTVIATFNAQKQYQGHAAIYVSQDATGISVYDQWVSGSNPKPIGPRIIRWTGHGVSNMGTGFYVVEN